MSPLDHHRRSIRLKGYDYSAAGAYFVTLCTYHRQCLFGEIVDDGMVVTAFGRVAQDEWVKSAQMRREIELDQFVIMPNHLHGIVIIGGHPVGAYGHTPQQREPLRSPSKTLGATIRGFKSAVTRQVNTIGNTLCHPVWQRNYYEHIIRNEDDFHRIAEYIATNPRRWREDYPAPGSSIEHHREDGGEMTVSVTSPIGGIRCRGVWPYAQTELGALPYRGV